MISPNPPVRTTCTDFNRWPVFIAFVLICVTSAASAQQHKIDSLQAIVNRYPNDLSALMALCEQTSDNDPAKAIKLGERALKLALAQALPLQTCRLYNMLGTLYNLRSSYDSSITSHRLALVLARQHNYATEELKACQGLAENFMRQSGNDSLRYYLEQALQVSARLKDPLQEAGIYNNLGNLYLNEENYEESLNYFIKSAKIYESAGNAKIGLSKAYANIGNIECILGNYDKAISYVQQSLSAATVSNYDPTIVYCHKLLGRIYRKKADLNEALKHYEEALKILDRLGDKRSACETHHSIGNIYFDQKKYKEALAQYEKSLKMASDLHNRIQLAYVYSAMGWVWYELKNPTKASIYLDSSIVHARAVKSNYIVMDAYQMLATLEEEQGHYQQALNYFHRYAEVKDSINEKASKERTDEIEARYQNEKKQSEISLLHKDQELKTIYLEQQRTVLIALTVAIGLLIIIGFLLFNRYKLIYKAKRQLEIEQVRNHIARDLHDDIGSTISSINIISQLAVKENKPEQFSRHFQRIEEQSSKVLESMSDMVWSINPDNDSVDKMVARMKEFAAEILEPLNINYEFKEDPALRHTTVDLEKRKNLFLVFKEALNNAAKYSKSSFIRIELLLQAGVIHLVVTDNGIGFDAAKVKPGNGLRNMKERAKEVNATLTWQAGPASGTVVTLDLPVA